MLAILPLLVATMIQIHLRIHIYIYTPPYRVRKNFRAGAKGARLYSLRIAQPSGMKRNREEIYPLYNAGTAQSFFKMLIWIF